jgi:hypothetical protein
MDTLPKAKTESPPPLFGTFVRGFNTVAGHVWLILPPVLLDLFLWFSPRLSLQKLLSPVFAQATADMIKTAGSSLPPNFQAANDLTQAMLSNSNLMTALRSYPIGVPSLMAMASPLVNALGVPVIYQVPSIQSALLIWLGLTLIGVLLGSLYFQSLARAASLVVETGVERKPGDQFGQVLLFTLLFYAILFAVGIPLAMILGLLTLMNPMLGQIVFMVGFFLVLWFLMPIVFSPFGIFTAGQKLLPSIAISFRLVRGYLKGTGLFVLFAVLIEIILDTLWVNAPANSWLMLVSITGHAFISTALITSAFIYYLGGMRWMQIRTTIPETITAA